MEVRILSALEGLLHAKADRQGHGPFRITRGPAFPASAGWFRSRDRFGYSGPKISHKTERLRGPGSRPKPL
jgi:hypothetical protein